jgi:glutaredoxin
MVSLLVFVGTACAEVYRYTDDKGEMHFVDDVAKVPKKYRKQLENAQPLPDISTMDATPAPSRVKSVERGQESGRSYEAKTVEVYMTAWCGYCRKMTRFLDEKAIPYTAYDIEKDAAAARTYRELGGSGVPVVRVGSQVIHGYNPDAVMSYLKGK